MKKGFYTNIEKDTLENNSFRKVLYTGKYSQLVVMSLQPGEEIGAEVHETHDQFFRFEQGKGKVVIDETTYDVEDDDVIVVPGGSNHNVINTGEEVMKLYTIYSPPEHREGVEHVTKAEADDEEFDGTTTE
mgnify:FL=1